MVFLIILRNQNLQLFEKDLKFLCIFQRISFLTPQRYIKYNLENVQYFYTKNQIEFLMNKLVKSYHIIDNDREFFVVSEF